MTEKLFRKDVYAREASPTVVRHRPYAFRSNAKMPDTSNLPLCIPPVAAGTAGLGKEHQKSEPQSLICVTFQGFVARIGVCPQFLFPQADLSCGHCDRYARCLVPLCGGLD